MANSFLNINRNKSLLWLIIEKGFKFFTGFLILLLITRYLGLEEFGKYSFIVSFVSLFAPFIGLGLDDILIKEFTKKNFTDQTLLNTSFALKVISFAIIFFSIIFTSYFLNYDQILTLSITIYSASLFFNGFNSLESFHLARDNYHLSVYSKIISQLVLLLFIVFIVQSNRGLSWIFFSYFIANLFYALLQFYWYKREFKWAFLCFDFKIAKKLLIMSLPLMVGGLAYIIQTHTDQLMIKYFLGFASAGIYSSSVNLIGLTIFIPYIFQKAFLSKIISLKEIKLKFNCVMVESYRLAIIMSLIVGIIFFSLSDYIINIFYGAEFKASGGVLALLSGRFAYFFFGVIRAIYLIVNGQQGLMMKSLIFSSIINIILNYILIPIMGINGAILATYISCVVDLVIIDLLNKRQNNFKFFLKALLSLGKFNMRLLLKNLQ